MLLRDCRQESNGGSIGVLKKSDLIDTRRHVKATKLPISSRHSNVNCADTSRISCLERWNRDDLLCPFDFCLLQANPCFKYELNKEDTKIHVKVDREKPMGPQHYTKFLQATKGC